jgi:hypothetical protein
MPRRLIDEISQFCAMAGIAETTFGRLAVNDGKLARRLRNGRDLKPPTVDRITAFMREYAKKQKDKSKKA